MFIYLRLNIICLQVTVQVLFKGGNSKFSGTKVVYEEYWIREKDGTVRGNWEKSIETQSQSRFVIYKLRNKL